MTTLIAIRACIALAAALAVALTTVACGDEDETEGGAPSESGILRQQYLAEVQAACGPYLQARAVAATPLEELLPSDPANATPAEARAAAYVLDEVNRANRELLGILRAIPEPATGAAAIGESLDLIEQAFDSYRQAAADARKGNVKAMAAGYEEGTELLSDASSVPRGFAFCG